VAHPSTTPECRVGAKANRRERETIERGIATKRFGSSPLLEARGYALGFRWHANAGESSERTAKFAHLEPIFQAESVGRSQTRRNYQPLREQIYSPANESGLASRARLRIRSRKRWIKFP
jgi:hypothetical protein